MNPGHILKIILIMLAAVVSACDKFDEEVLLGTWISTDKTDTLDFVDDSNFYKSNATMRYDHYDYNLGRDSIEIRYNGLLKIMVYPTKHKYELKGNRLTIDFTNRMCYGFPGEVKTYTRQ